MDHWQAQLDIHGPTDKVGTRLFSFLLVSITLHIFLLLFYGAPGISTSVLSQSIRITLINTQETDRTTALEDVKTPPVKADAKPTSAHGLKTESSYKPVHKDTKPTTPAETPRKSETTFVNDTEHKPDIPEPPNEMALNSAAVEMQNAQHAMQQRVTIQSLLRQALERHYHYPLLARRRGWHGEVLLGFTLDKRGSIINARVTKSSGHRTLDNAALKSLKQVAGIELHPTEALDFELPVIYNIYGG